jgi:class 3 adenylate cyclase
MLDDNQEKEVAAIVKSALDKAELIWGKHGTALDEAFIRADAEVLAKSERVPSRIPGQPEVEAGKEQVGTFIACVVDMRDSSKHLLHHITGTKASELKRVFFETSALLPALERTIQFESGSVTEYLGDGVLALFEVDEDDKDIAITKAYTAASNCLESTRGIVNQALKDRYNLPSLDIGIGMAMSRAVVSLVGIEGNSHPKATGRCVYYATKLSGCLNEILIDEKLDAAWPTTKEGKLQMSKRSKRGVEGFLVSRKN